MQVDQRTNTEAASRPASNRIYVVVTPIRNEERTLEKTIRSMIGQSVKPRLWVLVDDGSTDRTREIIEGYLGDHPWMRLILLADRGYRELGGGVVKAFNQGLEVVDVPDWEYVVKLDGDLQFGADYFENMLCRFSENPRLGMGSGKTFLIEGGHKRVEWCHDEHVRGPAKMYSRACFEEIGGLRAIRGWDTVDEITAQMKGYETRSFIEEELIHLRPIDGRQSHICRSRFEMGAHHHHFGYRWSYMFLRSVRSCLDEYPRPIGGGLLMLGYLRAALTRRPKYDPDFVRFVQAKQKERLSWTQVRAYLRASMARRPAAKS